MSSVTPGRSLRGWLATLLVLVPVSQAVAAQDVPDGEALYRQHCAGLRMMYGRVPTDAGVPNRLVMPRTLQSLT